MSVSPTTSQAYINDMLTNFKTILQSDYRPNVVADTYPESRKGLVYKTGKYTRKTVNYFKKPQSKASILVATWVIESIAYGLTFLVLLSSGAVITAALWTALYTYITYAFFTMLRDSIVFNSLL